MFSKRGVVTCWVVFAMSLGCLPGPASAYDYGLFIEVETEADLRELLDAKQIAQETFESLVDLLQQGVELQTADRDELYSLPNLTLRQVDAILKHRQESSGIFDPQELVEQGVIEARTLVSILPFVQPIPTSKRPKPLRGELNYTSNWSATDKRVPSMLFFSRMRYQSFQFGFSGFLVRQRLSSVRFDPQRRALSAETPQISFVPAKYYVAWRNATLQLVAGTYRIGFGQRLTFDNTSRIQPNGMLPDTTVNYSQQLSRVCRQLDAETEAMCDTDQVESPDFHATTRLRGLAIGWKTQSMARGWLQSYGFVSYAAHSVYQYEIIDRASCSKSVADPGTCSAPSVFVRREDPLWQTARLGYSTLPEMIALTVGGANLSYSYHSRSHVGVTGYAAHVSWLVEGMDLDLQNWSRLPAGGPFGALGVDWAWGSGIWDLFAEMTRSFDSQPSGGDWAFVLRSTTTWSQHQLDGLVRYYGPDFANPFTRSTSAPDEREGLRARDEVGLQVRYVGSLPRVRLGGLLDLWSPARDLHPKIRLRIRGDVRLLPWLWPGLWLEFVDKALYADLGRLACYDQPLTTENGKRQTCTGEKLQLVAALAFKPKKWLSLLAAYQHRFVDDGKTVFAHSFRQDLATWAQLTLRSDVGLQTDAKVRYVREAIGITGPVEEILSLFVQMAYQWEMGLWIQARYSLYTWMSQNKNPNPAHWLRLRLAYRF